MDVYRELDARLQRGQVRLATTETLEEKLDGGGKWVSTFSYPVQLLLLGGGHIAQSLSRLAALQGIQVTVADDRKDILNRENFPHGETLVHVDFAALPDELFTIPNAYTCIFTHGHSHDAEVLAQCCLHPLPYIGMIGSSRKIASCFDYARKAGIGDDVLSSVHSPIGLSINAVTPHEIAISIMAEIISTYRSDKHVVFVERDMIRAIAECRKGTVCRILESRGSSPGREGALMLVTKEGTLGTLGGGALEAMAAEEALSITEPTARHYDLTPKGDLGMTCGGDVTVLFTPRS